MATPFSSGTFVETVVTLAAAALLTFAGFEMLEGSGARPAASLATDAAGAPSTAATPVRDRAARADASRALDAAAIAMPHVDTSTV
jgi:hypothetical protein